VSDEQRGEAPGSPPRHPRWGGSGCPARQVVVIQRGQAIGTPTAESMAAACCVPKPGTMSLRVAFDRVLKRAPADRRRGLPSHSPEFFLNEPFCFRERERRSVMIAPAFRPCFIKADGLLAANLGATEPRRRSPAVARRRADAKSKVRECI